MCLCCPCCFKKARRIQTLDDAAKAAADVLDKLYPTNHTTEESLLKLVRSVVENPNIKLSFSSFKHTPATESAEGSVTGVLVLELGGEKREVQLKKTIDKLPPVVDPPAPGGDTDNGSGSGSTGGENTGNVVQTGTGTKKPSSPFGKRSLIDPGTGIQVLGDRISKEAKLTVSELASHTLDECEACAAIAAMRSTEEFLFGFTAQLSDTYEGSLHVTIPVEHEGVDKVQVLHCNGGVLEESVLEVKDGAIELDTLGLGYFAVAKAAADVEPEPEQPSPGETDSSVPLASNPSSQGGQPAQSGSAGWAVPVVVVVVLAAAAAAVVIVRRKKQS